MELKRLSRTTEEINPLLILRANELFHDLVKEDYDEEVGEGIAIKEKNRWLKSKKYFNSKKPLTILDIGTGTGFVPLTIAGFLEKKDTFICSDVSQEMLNLSKKKITEKNFKCKFKFIKTEKELPFDKEGINIITMDSVLHHIINPSDFLSSLKGILKKGGYIMICHEPNAFYLNNSALKLRYSILSFILDPKHSIKDFSKKLGLDKVPELLFSLISKNRREIIKKRKAIATEINNTLLVEGLTQKKYSYEEIISELIDNQVSKGFYPKKLIPDYEVVYFETYDHIYSLPEIYPNLRFIKKYSENLKKKYPNEGGLFFIILKKPF